MIGQKKVLFADTQVITAQMLKKCVIIQKTNNEEDYDEEKDLRKEKKTNQNPFQRGAMSFEDYNYNGLNHHILITKQKAGLTLRSEVISSSDNKKIDLTSNTLAALNLPEYDHQSILSGNDKKIKSGSAAQKEESDEEHGKEKKIGKK